MASSKRGFDPLEASKVVEDAPASEAAAPLTDAAPPEEPMEIAAPSPVPATPAKAYYLTKDYVMHWKGQTYSLKAGALVDEETFGRGAPLVFLEAGAPMRDAEGGPLTDGTCLHCQGTGRAQ